MGSSRTRGKSAYFLSIFAFLFLASCGSGPNSVDNSSDAGAIAFSLKWPGSSKPAARGAQSLQAVDCAATGVWQIQADVYTSTNALLKSDGPWDCTLGSATITSVTAGSNYKIFIYGLDNTSTKIYRGTQTGISVTAGATTPTGTVSMSSLSQSLSSITVTPASPSIAVNATQQLTATGNYSDSTTDDITSSVTWSSSDTGVVSVSATGMLFGVSTGSATVSATSGLVTGQVTVTITAGSGVTLSSIAVTPSTPSIAVSATQQFTATGTYSDSTTQDITANVTWSSSNSGIVSINGSGLATGSSAGSATVTATLGAISGNTSVTVTGVTLNSIAVTPATATIGEGGTQAFTATGSYSDSSTQNLTTSVTWSSSLNTVATISAIGIATGNGGGTATITATIGSLTPATASVTVDPLPTITFKSPADGATSVAINSTISATFSEAVNTSTVTTSTFTVSGSVTGTIALSGGNTIATFMPSSSLAYGTTYTVTLTTGIKDIAGNPIAATSWSFTTVDQWISEVKKLLASDAQASDIFGSSVAISGDYAVVGAPNENAGGSYAGAAYIFHRDPTTDSWDGGTKITASDAQAWDWFGRSVAISGDYAIVGAYGEDAGGTDAGAAYIFHRTGTNTWDSGTKITSSDLQAYDSFGWSVAISGDYAIVGANAEDGGSGDPINVAGAAYIFLRTGGINSWDSGTKIVASDAQANDQFGYSVAISGDYAIVGARYEDGSIGDPSSPADGPGAAYIYRRTGTTTWDSGKKITASDTQVNDQFGVSVAISGDYTVVGAYAEDTGGSYAGAAYIFLRTGTNTWDGGTKITASDAQVNDWFGFSVAISGDYAVVGAYSEDGGSGNPISDAGAAYIFSRTGTNSWDSGTKITASDAQAGDAFGRSVGISGNYAVVGAYSEDGGSGDPINGAGAAYIFR